MATTSFSESFKYGSRLFGLFVLILLVGGGALAGGAALAVPEILAWRGSGTAETPFIAGGLILSVFGVFVLVSGQFAIIYKLVADGVSRGNADPAVGPSETDDAETEADEQGESEPVAAPAGAETAEQPAETEPPQEPEPPAESQPAQEPEPQTQKQQPPGPPAEPKPQPQQSAQPASEQPQEPASAEGGREQTAEEIVFGSSEGADEQPAENEPDDSTGGFEFEEEPDETSAEDVETAGNPSSDPLADNFDDE